MSSVAFDNTTLSVLLDPNGKPVRVPGTNTPVEFAKERVDALIAKIEKSRRKIILPAPACAELLTAIGPDAQQYLTVIGRSRIFEIGSFDARCAAELALLNRGVFAHMDETDRAEPYQKRKVDRQIVAICKVYGVEELYTDDKGLAKSARISGITPISISEIPVPETSLQGSLVLEPHEELPTPED